MKLLPIYGGLFSSVDDCDFERLNKFKWHLSKRTASCYVVRSLRVGKITHKFYLHREVMGAVEGQYIDHSDNNFLNNQKSNLRFCTQSQNLANRRRPDGCKFKFRGLVKNSNGKWGSRIKVRGKPLWLGSFLNELDAAKAYDLSAIKHYGEFATLNFPIIHGIPAGGSKI